MDSGPGVVDSSGTVGTVAGPCGLTKAGLPAGLQIVGPLYADALVLRAAQAFEEAAPFVMPEI